MILDDKILPRYVKGCLHLVTFPRPSSRERGEDEVYEEAVWLTVNRPTSFAALSGSMGPVSGRSILVPFRRAEGQSVLGLGSKRLVRDECVSR
jgi:hypothetical protein